MDRRFGVTSVIFSIALFSGRSGVGTSITSTLKTFNRTKLSLVPAGVVRKRTLLSVLPFGVLGFFTSTGGTNQIQRVGASGLIGFFPVIKRFGQLDNNVLLPALQGRVKCFRPFHYGASGCGVTMANSSNSNGSFVVRGVICPLCTVNNGYFVLSGKSSCGGLARALNKICVASNAVFLGPFARVTGTRSLRKGSFSSTSADALGRTSRGSSPVDVLLNSVAKLVTSVTTPGSSLNSCSRDTLDSTVLVT